MENKITGLALLREPFPENQISLLPRATKKDAQKGNCTVCGGYHGLPAVHLKYVGHAALTDRLLDADPNWNWEPLASQDGLPKFDSSGGLWIKLTVCGQTRLGYGHAESSNFKDAGSREKEVIGDALRNAAMRFGAALDLWHKGDLHEHHEADKEKSAVERPDKKEPAPAEKADVVKILKAFSGLGISSAQILDYLGSDGSISVDDIEELKRIGKDIQTKKVLPNEIFKMTVAK